MKTSSVLRIFDTVEALGYEGLEVIKQPVFPSIFMQPVTDNVPDIVEPETVGVKLSSSVAAGTTATMALFILYADILWK